MQEKQVAILSCIAAAADMHATMRALNEPGVYEINPVLGKHPKDREVIFVLGVTQVLSLVFAHYFPDWRIPFLGGKFLLNTGCAIHNTSLY